MENKAESKKVKAASIHFERWKLDDLKPAGYNPRKRLRPGDPEYEKLKNSIDKLSYVDPIVINYDGTVIGGHQRLFVLQDLGYTEADVSVVHLSKQDEMALNLALNKISGDWDIDKLPYIFQQLKIADYDLSLTGFDDDEVSDILAGIVEDEREEEEKYSQSVESPIYHVTGDVPDISELCDTSKYHELLRDIETDESITEEEREFLKLAATRHIVFNYKKIAEYYADADAGMQGLMEDSALVIIDFDKANDCRGQNVCIFGPYHRG